MKFTIPFSVRKHESGTCIVSDKEGKVAVLVPAIDNDDSVSMAVSISTFLNNTVALHPAVIPSAMSAAFMTALSNQMMKDDTILVQSAVSATIEHATSIWNLYAPDIEKMFENSLPEHIDEIREAIHESKQAIQDVQTAWQSHLKHADELSASELADKAGDAADAMQFMAGAMAERNLEFRQKGT